MDNIIDNIFGDELGKYRPFCVVIINSSGRVQATEVPILIRHCCMTNVLRCSQSAQETKESLDEPKIVLKKLTLI